MIDRGDNTYGGKYVINPSGGLISKGHPLGATGMKILCLKQNMAQQDYYFESTTAAEFLIVVQCNYRVWCSHTATHSSALRSNSHEATAWWLRNVVHVTGLPQENSVRWTTNVLPSAVLRSCLHGTPVVGGKLSKPHHEQHLFFDWLAMWYPISLGGTAKLLQAVAQIVILLCIYSLSKINRFKQKPWTSMKCQIVT